MHQCTHIIVLNNYADLTNTFVPNVCLVTGGGRSGGVATVARGGMDNVSGGMVVREDEKGYWGNAVGNWGEVSGAGSDGRRGLDERGVTGESCEYDGWTKVAVPDESGFQPTESVSEVYKWRWCLRGDVSAWVLAGCLPSNCTFSKEEIILGNSPGKCWWVVSCVGTDGRWGLNEVVVTWEGCEYDGWTEAVATPDGGGVSGNRVDNG